MPQQIALQVQLRSARARQVPHNARGWDQWTAAPSL